MSRQYSRFEAFLRLEMDEKEVVVRDNSMQIEYKDKLKGKMHYSLPGEWIKEKDVKDSNKYCINNYVINNEPVFLAKTSGIFINFYKI